MFVSIISNTTYRKHFLKKMNIEILFSKQGIF